MGYGPTPKLYLRFNNISDEFPFTHTSVTVAKPDNTMNSSTLRVVGASGLENIRHTLVDKYAGEDNRDEVGKIFDTARDRIHSPNPLKRFVNGFKNPGPQILE